jgi:UPF0755 protein
MKRPLTSLFCFLIILWLLLFPPKAKYIVGRVCIPVGATSEEIASILCEHKIIGMKQPFVILSKIKGVERKLKAGEYELNNRMSVLEILDKLVRGETVSSKFTIPEGYTIREIARKLASMGLVREERFIKLCREPWRFHSIQKIPGETLEGYLFPDTYYVGKGMKAEDIIKLMFRRFWELIGRGESVGRAESLGFTLHEIVILASIIEKEATVEEEKPIISAVFHNRLRKNLPLEADPTILYALGKHKERVTYSDLKVPSPYNTYLNPGLPPAPICNPGKTSIKAALNPARVPYLYFVSRGDGTHEFSTTYTQHLRAKRKFKRH